MQAMSTRTRRQFVAAAALFLATAGATAAPPWQPAARGLVFTEAGHPLSFVPGRDDGLALSSFSIGQLAVSPNGRHWVLTATGTATAETPSRQVVLSGGPRGLRLAAVQGDLLPGLELAFSQNPDLVAIGNGGDFAFGMSVAGAGSGDRQMVARYRMATSGYEKVARQGDEIPGLAASVPAAAGERYGSQLAVAAVLDDGRVGFVARGTSGPLPGSVDDFLLVDGDPVQVVLQGGVFVPAGQADGGSAVLANLERRAGMTADGGRWLAWGQLAGPGAPDVVVVDGEVALREGQPVPGLAGDVFAPTTTMGGSGSWTARGTSTAGERYLIVDGVLRVLQGQPIDGLPELGPVENINSASVNRHGDLAYAISTADGRPWIIVEPAGGGPALVAVSDRTRLNVGASSRGVLYYGGTLGGSDLGVALGDNRMLYFMTRAQDRNRRNVADGLFVIGLPPPRPR